MDLIFLDANIFLYALGADSEHRIACRDVLTAVGAGRLDGVTDSEVLQEIIHVRRRRTSLFDAIQAARMASELVSFVFPVTKDDVLSACELLDEHPSLSTRDAIHAAVMIGKSIAAIVSVDYDFDILNNLRRYGPGDILLSG